MKAGDLGELAVRNLREAILRNSLTTLGVGVGVASLVAMVSLGVGLQELVTKRLSSAGMFDTVMVTQKMNFRGFGRPRAAAEPQDSRPLDDAAKKAMEQVPNVVEVFPQIRFFTEIRYAGNPYTTTVVGIPESAREGGSFDGMKGNFFSGASADEAILQIEFAKELSDKPETLIGKDLSIRYAERQALGAAANPEDAATDPAKKNGKGAAPKGTESGDARAGGFSVIPRETTLRIIGVIETEPAAGFGGYGAGRLLIPLQLAQTLQAAQANDLRDIVRATSNGRPGYASLTVRASSPSKVGAIETAIKGMGFAAFSIQDAARNIRLFFMVFDMILAIFGSLALAVATLGIVNTLVMAILERRREIGILKALGADNSDVKQLFFVEAGVMGFFGGILGVGLGWMIGRAVTIGIKLYLKQQDLPPTNVFSVPWWLVIGAIAFAVGVSLVAGLYPASRAARLDPVEALRYE
jgi:putative ABC transport system permease protein